MSDDISPQERRLLDWLASQSGAMQSLLETLVNIDSGSYNKAGVDRVGAAICGFLDNHGIRYDVIANERFGNAIRATVGAPGDLPKSAKANSSSHFVFVSVRGARRSCFILSSSSSATTLKVTANECFSSLR